jgi:hypothetical protein
MLTLIILPLVGTASATTFALTVHTDASAYSGSQRIVISGSVSPAPNSTATAVFVTVFNPDHVLVIANSTEVNAATGAFVDVEFAGGTVTWIPGQYLVNASWGASGSVISGTAAFTYSAVSTSSTASETSISSTTSTGATVSNGASTSTSTATSSTLVSTSSSSTTASSASLQTSTTSSPTVSSSATSLSATIVVATSTQTSSASPSSSSSTSTVASSVSSKGSTLSSGTSDVFAYVGIGTVIVVVAVIGVLLLVRRRTNAPSAD